MNVVKCFRQRDNKPQVNRVAECFCNLWYIFKIKYYALR